MAKTRVVSAALRCAILVACATITCGAQTLLPRVSILPDAPVPAQYSSSKPIPPSATPLVNGDVSWKTLPFNILRDQKLVWLFPLQLAKGQHLIPAAAIVGTTAGLIQADPPAMRYFGRTTDWNRFNENFNGAFTGSLEAAIPASLYVFGLVRHDSYAERTALLAGEAYADSAIPHVVIKIVARRVRPNAVMPGSDYTNTFFHSTITPFGKGSSFPSGHAAGAFSIATVIARRYGDHRWVPFVAYGLAAFVSFSRVPDRAHYPSDVFLGAALGYVITRYDTLREKE
jgi:membrane-associated phospholipid phosphatase